MSDFAFKVNIVAVVQERAAEQNVARKVVPTVLAAPGTTKIRLAKMLRSPMTIVTNVNLLIEGGSIDLVESFEVAPASAICSARRAHLVANSLDPFQIELVPLRAILALGGLVVV